MSKFCPFCDDVKDSNLDTYEKFKQHLEQKHSDEIVETGSPEKLEEQNKNNGGDDFDKAVQPEFREVEKS